MLIRKAKSLLIAVLFVSVLIAGCTPGTPATTTGSTTANPTASPYADKMEISLAIWDLESSMSSQKPDPIFDALLQKFNVTIKPVGVTWDDFNDKINVWAAGGMLPDAFITDQEATNNFTGWVKGGLLKALPSDLSKYPNLAEVMVLPDIAGSAIDGKQYFIPRMMYFSGPYLDNRAIIIRSDWMTKVGWENDPQNADEFLQLMKDLTYKDPDGNGKNDTPGLSAVRQDFLVNYPLLFFNPALPSSSAGANWVKEDGKWIPAFMSQKMEPYIVFMRKLVTEGVVDMDFATYKGDEARDKFISGKVASYIRGGSIGDISQTYENWVKLYPDPSFEKSVKVLTTPKSDDGKAYHYAFANYYSSTLLNAKIDDAKTDRILAIIDYTLSEEWVLQRKLGIEGKDYKKDGTTITITRPKDENDNYISISTLYPNTVNFDMGTFMIDFVDPSLNPMIIAKNQEWKTFLETTETPDVNFKAVYTKVPAAENYTYTWMDEVVKIMLSTEEPVQMWRDYLKNEETKGLANLVTEMNSVLGQ